jgi:DNA-binding XRE family transcriptional regulator
MVQNVDLKIAIIKSGKKQKEVAAESGIHPTVLSMAIGGRYNLSESEKFAIAESLGLQVNQIFSE